MTDMLWIASNDKSLLVLFFSKELFPHDRRHSRGAPHDSGDVQCARRSRAPGSGAEAIHLDRQNLTFSRRDAPL
jgi:hypothetical protein